MKKVLIIAFIYPPLGGSGVQRTLKFTKYLPEFGWQPYVVCSDDPQVFGHGLDPSLVDEIPPQAQVWRCPFVNPLSLRRRVQQLLGVKRSDQRLAGIHQSASVNNLTTREPPRAASNLKSKFQNQISSIFPALSSPLAPFDVPPIDAALYWALAIIPGCLRLIRKEKIDLLFTTSFPYSDHLVGYLLKKLTGLPWVADFRDPWTQNASARNTGWRYRVDQWVEQRVLNTADRVIGVTPTYTADLHRLAPGRDSAAFVTIENGYDAADFGLPTPSLRGSALGDRSNLETASQSTLAVTPDPSLRGSAPGDRSNLETASQSTLAVTPDPSLRGSDLGDRSNLETALQSTLAVTPDPSLRGSAPGDRSNLTLVHVGKVYDGTALPFLQAQGALGEAGARLQVRFIGGLAPQEQAWLKTHPLAVQVQVEPRLAHAEAIQAMQAADVLLLFVLGRDSRSGHYPGKLFEYLASGRPVLLVGPQGDAADLLRRSGTGCAVDAAQANAIVEILKSLVEKPAAFLNQYYRPRSEVIAAYERQALTARLAAVFDSLTQPLSA